MNTCHKIHLLQRTNKLPPNDSLYKILHTVRMCGFGIEADDEPNLCKSEHKNVIVLGPIEAPPVHEVPLGYHKKTNLTLIFCADSNTSPQNFRFDSHHKIL